MGASLDNDRSPDGGLGQIVSINVTPFVDVVLVLLIIFMVTAPMLVKQMIQVNLPQANSGTAAVDESVGLAVTASGLYMLNGVVMDLENIRAALNNYQSTAQIIISADKESRHGSVVEVLDLVRSLGFTRLAFQVERQ